MTASLLKYKKTSGQRSASILFFTISLIMRLQTSATSEDYKKGLLDRPFPRHLMPGPMDADGGPREDYLFDSMSDQPFPQELDDSFILEDEAQSTQLWPRVMLDYMRQQLRYRGRTKKSTRKKKTQPSS